MEACFLFPTSLISDSWLLKRTIRRCQSPVIVQSFHFIYNNAKTLSWLYQSGQRPKTKTRITEFEIFLHAVSILDCSFNLLLLITILLDFKSMDDLRKRSSFTRFISSVVFCPNKFSVARCSKKLLFGQNRPSPTQNFNGRSVPLCWWVYHTSGWSHKVPFDTKL